MASETTAKTLPADTTGDPNGGRGVRAGHAVPATEETGEADRLRSPGWFYSFVPNKLGMGSTISLPPIFLTEVLGGSLAQVGVVTSLTSAATVPAAAFWGWLSDRVGTRKLYLILGFLGFALPTIAMGFSETVLQFMALSVLVGALSVAGTPVSSTLIMDTTAKEEWDEAFGRFNQIGGWGMVAGRVLGLAVIAYGIALFGNETTLRGLWVIGGGLSLLSVAWAIWAVPALGMPKPRPPRRPAAETVPYVGYPLVERVRFLPHMLYHLPRVQVVAAVRALFFNAQVGLEGLPETLRRTTRWGWQVAHEPLAMYLIATFVQFTMSTMAYTPFAVWQRQALGNTTGDVFFVGLMNSLAAAFSYRAVGVWTHKFGSLRVQMAAVLLRVGVFGGFAVMSVAGLRGWPTMAALIVLQIMSGVSWAGLAVAGNSTVARLAPRGNEGTAIGTYTSAISIGAIVGAFVSGYLVEAFSYTFVYAAGAVGVGLIVLVLWRIRRSVPNPSEHNL